MRMWSWAAALLVVVRPVDRVGGHSGCAACGRCSKAGPVHGEQPIYSPSLCYLCSQRYPGVRSLPSAALLEHQSS